MHTALITGGASGIGEATARRFATAGATVAILDQNPDGARVAEEIGGHFRQVDVSDAAALERAVAEAASALGSIHACVAAAGILETPSTILDMDVAAHDRIWQVNYHGTVHTCRAAGRVMQGQGKGAIVTLGSINSLAALPLPGYCPSKTAILRLTEMLAVELGRFGVRVNGVAPTYVMTPAIRARVEAGERDPAIMSGANALGLLVEPDHIARVIEFLCSDGAAAVSGVMLPVDAGHLPKDHFACFAGGLPWQTNR